MKKSYWEKETRKYSHSHARLVIIAKIIHDLKLPKPRILDLGAGEGQLKKILNPYFSYFGVDITGDRNTSLKESKIYYCNLEQITPKKFPTLGIFDIVVVSGVFEYLKNWQDIFNVCCNTWLKNNGTVIFSFINKKFYSSQNIIRPHDHWVNTYELSSLLNLFDKKNMEIQYIYPGFAGNYMWTVPIMRILCIKRISKNAIKRIDNRWISQYIIVAKKKA